MLRQSTGRLKARVPDDLVRDYWQVPVGTNVKQVEVDMFIIHIFNVGLQQYVLERSKNVSYKSI
jgi:hypothetical protein